MGRLGYETYNGLSYKCLAVLITNQHLLAPAHCFDDNEKMPVSYVLLGDWNPTNSYMDTDCDDQHMCNRLPKLMEIDEIIINPDYNSEDLTNDISVLKLSQPIMHFSSSIRPICLPSINSQISNQHIGELLYSSGFALDASLRYKLKDLVQIVGNRQCRRTLANLKHLSAAIPYEMNHICGVGSNSRMPLLKGSALMGVHIEGQELQNYYLIGLLVDGSQQTVNRYTVIC
ncbi:uncharacterized protein Dwil_GK27994 [Drosophila willistoni]|uniref:Peptidase S1 domain-containing protein n=1 Tax=Drosophila willistoni TaxID=7260 RepID=A0A0Q9WWA3_DROWI|nr:uncharacterized protein Dwil_GK27994 [Drosophila willistoni]